MNSSSTFPSEGVIFSLEERISQEQLLRTHERTFYERFILKKSKLALRMMAIVGAFVVCVNTSVAYAGHSNMQQDNSSKKISQTHSGQNQSRTQYIQDNSQNRVQKSPPSSQNQTQKYNNQRYNNSSNQRYQNYYQNGGQKYQTTNDNRSQRNYDNVQYRNNDGNTITNQPLLKENPIRGIQRQGGNDQYHRPSTPTPTKPYFRDANTSSSQQSSYSQYQQSKNRQIRQQQEYRNYQYELSRQHQEQRRQEQIDLAQQREIDRLKREQERLAREHAQIIQNQQNAYRQQKYTQEKPYQYETVQHRVQKPQYYSKPPQVKKQTYVKKVRYQKQPQEIYYDHQYTPKKQQQYQYQQKPHEVQKRYVTYAKPTPPPQPKPPERKQFVVQKVIYQQQYQKHYDQQYQEPKPSYPQQQYYQVQKPQQYQTQPQYELTQATDMRVYDQSHNISEHEKQLIDRWLQDNNLNEYGDPMGTSYSGGTPLFNEETGEYIERYTYLIMKFPDRPWLQYDQGYTNYSYYDQNQDYQYQLQGYCPYTN